ncbi:MAG: nucleoside transporter [Deltaproteobacteria bacterium]|nr:nucleoside transporter [Deltaproteobacteria bacterium]
MGMYNLVSFCGIFIIMGLGWLFSTHRRTINWRLLRGALILQAVFALFIFKVPIGSRLFLGINSAVITVLEAASAGSRFVFGRLALAPGAIGEAGEPSLGFFLAFQAFPTIIFFSALMSILYYIGVLPWLISRCAALFTRLFAISGAESLCAASNMFVGVESALTVKPYLRTMTRSELCTVLTCGMATVASNVLALYVFTLQEQFPAIAGHLVSASIIAAPSALIMSKLVVPETGAPATLGRSVAPFYEREHSVFEAVINGANTGVRVVVGIVALLLAVLGLVALVDLGIIALGSWINSAAGLQVDWSLRGLAGLVFYPLTVIIGVPLEDAVLIARIIGERLIVTEVVSYQHLAAAMADGAIANPRSTVIATYALCGFAHLASMAIFIGGVSALVPDKTAELSRVGFRALLAATLACLLTACIAGTFYTSGSILGAG